MTHAQAVALVAALVDAQFPGEECTVEANPTILRAMHVAQPDLTLTPSAQRSWFHLRLTLGDAPVYAQNRKALGVFLVEWGEALQDCLVQS